MNHLIGYQSKKNDEFDWNDKLLLLLNIIKGLKIIHQKQMVHRDFYTGNLLVYGGRKHTINWMCISDMGLCGEVGNTGKETKIYGVMPYVAPEVLNGKPYTQAADIYSFGMIMYFVATGRQPFADRAYCQDLALSICNGIRPEITEKDAPKCYIDLMKRCWDPDPNNRPNANEINKLVWLLRSYLEATETKDYRIKEIGEGGFAKVYSAIREDGPLLYKDSIYGYTRDQNKKVALKCLNNSQNITYEFLNEV